MTSFIPSNDLSRLSVADGIIKEAYSTIFSGVIDLFNLFFTIYAESYGTTPFCKGKNVTVPKILYHHIDIELQHRKNGAQDIITSAYIATSSEHEPIRFIPTS